MRGGRGVALDVGLRARLTTTKEMRGVVCSGRVMGKRKRGARSDAPRYQTLRRN